MTSSSYGDFESLNAFMIMLNDNDRGIVLQYEAGKTEIHFLDLKLQLVDGDIIRSTYFKETDRNGFISTNSCHHGAWLRSVPRSQFLRLRRNCTNQDDFLQEASILKKRFLEKGL